MPLGNLEKIIEEQIGKARKKTGFIPGKKIFLFFLVMFVLILASTTYYFRKFIGPVNSVVKSNSVIQKNLTQINNYIAQADFQNAARLMHNTNNDLNNSLIKLDKMDNSGYKFIDNSIALFKENLQLSNNYLSNLNSYLNLVDKYTIRVQVYDKFSLTNRPIGLIPQETQDTLSQTKSRLELNTYALAESCSQNNHYINKINLCPKLEKLNQSIDQIIKQSNLPTDLQIGKQTNLTQS